MKVCECGAAQAVQCWGTPWSYSGAGDSEGGGNVSRAIPSKVIPVSAGCIRIGLESDQGPWLLFTFFFLPFPCYYTFLFLELLLLTIWRY